MRLVQFSSRSDGRCLLLMWWTAPAPGIAQVHGIDAAENVVVRKQLRRRQMLKFFKALPPCLIGMEACATSHYWARRGVIHSRRALSQ